MHTAYLTSTAMSDLLFQRASFIEFTTNLAEVSVIGLVLSIPYILLHT